VNNLLQKKLPAFALQYYDIVLREMTDKCLMLEILHGTLQVLVTKSKDKTT